MRIVFWLQEETIIVEDFKPTPPPMVKFELWSGGDLLFNNNLTTCSFIHERIVNNKQVCYVFKIQILFDKFENGTEGSGVRG